MDFFKTRIIVVLIGVAALVGAAAIISECRDRKSDIAGSRPNDRAYFNDRLAANDCREQGCLKSYWATRQEDGTYVCVCVDDAESYYRERAPRQKL